jgi:hypothetical protein
LRTLIRLFILPGERVFLTDEDGMAKNTICLWYEGEAEAAERFYAETFPDMEFLN